MRIGSVMRSETGLKRTAPGCRQRTADGERLRPILGHSVGFSGRGRPRISRDRSGCSGNLMSDSDLVNRGTLGTGPDEGATIRDELEVASPPPFKRQDRPAAATQAETAGLARARGASSTLGGVIPAPGSADGTGDS